MKSLLWLATLGIVALSAKGSAQEPAKKPDKADSTRTLYMVQGLH
jgi:hypothetical protein